MNHLYTRFCGLGGAGSRQRGPLALVLVTATILATLLFTLLGGCSSPPDDSRRSVSVTGDFGTPFQFQINNFSLLPFTWRRRWFWGGDPAPCSCPCVPRSR